MDLQFTAEDQAFRAEVRGFLRDNLPPRIRDQVIRTPSYLGKEDVRTWHKILHGRGWSAPHWPKQFGGTGWTESRAMAPTLSPMRPAARRWRCWWTSSKASSSRC